MKAAFWLTALSVSLTSIAVTSMITFHLFKKKGRAGLRKIHNSPQTETTEQNGEDFFDVFSFNCNGSIKQRKEIKRENGIHNRSVYPYLDCPLNSIYAKSNKWINDTATHNTNHIGEVIEKENAVVVGICNMVASGLEGSHFIIEDIYGRITTEPAKFKPAITADELRGRLIIFKGHVEDKKFTVKTVSRTKFEIA